MTNMSTDSHTPIAVPCEELDVILNHVGQGIDLPGDVVLAVERVRGRYPAEWSGDTHAAPSAPPFDVRNVPNPNVIEFVPASEIKSGDDILVQTTIFHVNSVMKYIVAYDDDRPVRTSLTEHGNRWRILHIGTNYGGLVRFPHETVARLARVEPHVVPESEQRREQEWWAAVRYAEAVERGDMPRRWGAVDFERGDSDPD